MDTNNELVTEVIKKVPIEDIYNKGLQPAVTEFGYGLKNAVKLALAPINGLAWGYDLVSEFIKCGLLAYFEKRNIDKDKIVPPDIATAIPAIEAMRYTKDEIRVMLLNLLGASMNKETSEFVHPAFVEILKQMTPDEAKILNQLPKVLLHEPIMDIAVEKPLKDGKFTVFNSVGVIGKEANCEFPDRLPLYLTNLVRLGLVEIPENSGLADDWRYDKIRNSSLFLEKVEFAEKKGKVFFLKKMVGITALGSDLRKTAM